MSRIPLWQLLLTALGALLVVGALFIPYAHVHDGGSITLVDFDFFKQSVWGSLLPVVVAVGAALSSTIAYPRSRSLASGLMLGLGAAALVDYLALAGQLIVSDYADIRVGAFVGILGGAILLAVALTMLLMPEHARPSAEPLADAPGPAAPGPVSGEATKVCPDCAEEIRAAAAKCRYCGYRFA